MVASFLEVQLTWEMVEFSITRRTEAHLKYELAHLLMGITTRIQSVL
jgi:hypothetical protein